jgi:DNA-binding protein H-NS
MNTFKGQAGVRLAVIYPNNQRVPMSSYKELLAQREKLEKQIEEAKSREYAEVLNEIKQKMADYGITLAELGGGRAQASHRNIATRTAAARGLAVANRRAGSQVWIVTRF